MAEQQITIDYTVAATKRLPAVDVQLVVTYDDAAKRTKLQEKRGSYTADSASGTYTTTTTTTTAGKGTPVTLQVYGLKHKARLGNNDNQIYPSGNPRFLDRRGISFALTDPLKGAPKHVKIVNIFNDPEGGDHLQQYSSYESRDLVSFKVTGPTPVVSTVSATTSSAFTETDMEDATTMCFAEGTLIRTARGDVAVEALAVGDLAMTASGALRPITWLGNRTLDLRRHRCPADSMPVRIAAHAFGAGLPARDLFLSPGHPVLVGADADHEGGSLVPIMCLVNGTTIERVRRDTVIYWHVELDAHDILLADGLPAESYIEWGDRAFFAEASDDRLANPDLVAIAVPGRCRPVAIDGPIVEAERDRLDSVFATRLARACAWPGTEAALDL